MITKKIYSFVVQLIKRYNKIFFYLLGAFLTKGISYLTTPVFTRIMSVEDFGTLSLLTTWTTIFSIFVAAQISGTVPSVYVKYKDRTETYIGKALVLSVVTFLICLIMSIFVKDKFASVMNLHYSFLLPWTIFLGYGKAMSNLYVAYTVQKKQPKKNVLFSFGVALMTLLLSVAFALLRTEDKFIGKIIGETIVYSIVIIFIFHFFKIRKSKVDISFWKEELSLSVPLIFHLLATNIISQSDKIFISNMIGLAATAVYSVAHTIGMLALVVVEAVFNVWAPWFFEQMELSKHNREINTMFRICVLSMACVFGLIMLFSKELFMILAPDSYQGGINCTIIVAISTFFSFYYRFPLCFEQYNRQMKWVAIATGVASICNIILNYFLIPFLGINGAAIATMISQIFLWIIHEMVVRYRIKNYPICARNYLFGIMAIVPAIIMAIANSENFLVRIGISLMYIVFIFILFYRLLFNKSR